MNLFSIFSLFGKSSCSAQEMHMTQHGNFTIGKKIIIEKGSGRTTNRDSETKSYLIEYKIFHKGKKVKLPSLLNKNNRYSFPWRVYILQDAPIPTLIAGSEKLVLITEQEGQLKILPIDQYPSKFASLQWLDSKNGLPGDEVQIYDLQNDHLIDSSIVLMGGKNLLINKYTVLNIGSLTQYRFNKKNQFEFEGWRLVLESPATFEIATGFSEKYHKVVFRALKLDEKIEGKFYCSLISFDYKMDTISITPFSRTSLRIQKLEEIDSKWFERNFQWNDHGAAVMRTGAIPPPWQGTLAFPDKDYITYKVYPVSERIVSAFLEFLKSTYARRKELSIIDETNTQSVLLRYQVKLDDLLFQLTYDKQDMTLIFERHFKDSHSEKHRDKLTKVAETFNNELKVGTFDSYFTKLKGE